MCNTYVVRPKRDAKGQQQRINEAAALLKSYLVRKSDPGVVMRADGQVDLMRWGFHRQFNPAINNAREDKLEGGMWQEAFHQRRCVIPMTLFYEWGPGADGRKQACEFCSPDDDLLWAAGIWEPHAELGPCYSMITTESSSVMATIHNRMPALLRSVEMEEWLVGSSKWDFEAFAGSLVVAPCESPLTKRPSTGPQQAELF